MAKLKANTKPMVNSPSSDPPSPTTNELERDPGSSEGNKERKITGSLQLSESDSLARIYRSGGIRKQCS